MSATKEIDQVVTIRWRVVQCKSDSLWGRVKGQRYYHRVEHVNGQTIYTSELTSKANMITVSRRIYGDLSRSVLDELVEA